MAGIFRYNANSSTPSKRHTLSPFCTSPGQLQDVTMDNSYALGYRSPCLSLQHAGSTSPGQGRSVREFEEQMASLRKENFNLKLRIYFLEEKIPGYSSSNTDGHESLLKQNVDLKVDIEVLRKELQEKQSLLCEAAKAMELMEQQQKATEEKSNGIIEELNQKIHYLEMENKQLERSTNQHQMDEIMGRTDIVGDIDMIQKVRELEGCLNQHREKNEELTAKIDEMEKLIVQKDKKIVEFEDKVKQITFQNAELEEQLDMKQKEASNAEYSRLREELHDYKTKLADKICLLEEVELKLKEKTAANENACKAIQKLMIGTKELQEELDRLKKTDALPNASHVKEESYGNNSTALCGSLIDSLEVVNVKTKLEDAVAEKATEIDKLKADLKKKKSNLLVLINEEIWKKKRQIENLTSILKRLNPSLFASLSPTRDVEQLQQSFSEAEYLEAVECNRSLQRKVDVLIQRLFALSEANSEEVIHQLQTEINSTREEVEKAHRWRKDACVVLTERLEELAGFLDSLLKHKDILGALAADRSREMRKAIDRSLDISRSLNMSLSITGMSMTEQSFAQLSNISGLLDLSMDNKENKPFAAYKKTIKEQTELIENLQTEIKALKKESVRKRASEVLKKERRSLPPSLENQSESETWSEPDRSVSLARMGLEKSPGGFNSKKNVEEQKPSTSSESELGRKTKSKTQEKINQLENIIAIRDDRLLEVQCELVEADNRLKQENLRVLEISHELEEYKKANEMLRAEIANYKCEAQHHDEQRDNLKCIINEKVAIIERIQDERDKLSIDARVAEMKIDTLKKDMEELKEKHEKNLEKAAEDERLRMEQLQKDMLARAEQKLKEQEDKHREYLARDWVSRVIYDEIKYDLESTQKKFNEAQGTIEYLQENESELTKKLIESEKAMRNLKKSLDEATLQASKIVIERSKVLHDKAQLESRIEDFMQKLEIAEQEKTELSERIKKLEKSNALLTNNLLNNSAGQYKQAKKQPSNGSDASQSGYTSEDVPLPSNQGGAQRLENSSPDLGIESDAGRASSVELAGAQNRLLKSIENFGSAQNLLEEETWKLQDKIGDGNEDNGENNNCPNAHDCTKAEKEIFELRRKLARTKRALEDTVKKLRTSNQRKEQIERDIRQQILKTHSVLKNVRTNMESELDQHKQE